MSSLAEPLRVETFQDIVRILRERPEWLEEMRRLILTDELLALPKRFDTFVREEFSPLKQDVATLKQDVDTLKRDVEVLKQDVAVLKQDVEILKQDVAVLKQDVEILKQDVAVLKQDVETLKRDVAELKGAEFERRVRERAPAYLGRLIKRCRTLSFEDLADLLEDAVEKGLISEEEKAEVLNLDAVAGGISKADGRRCFLTLEVSVRVDVEDVERAARRASILSRAAKVPAVGVVVGREIAERASLKAEELGVVAV